MSDAALVINKSDSDSWKSVVPEAAEWDGRRADETDLGLPVRVS